jgi:hypothetical protein
MASVQEEEEEEMVVVVEEEGEWQTRAPMASVKGAAAEVLTGMRCLCRLRGDIVTKVPGMTWMRAERMEVLIAAV